MPGYFTGNKIVLSKIDSLTFPRTVCFPKMLVTFSSAKNGENNLSEKVRHPFSLVANLLDDISVTPLFSTNFEKSRGSRQAAKDLKIVGNTSFEQIFREIFPLVFLCEG